MKRLITTIFLLAITTQVNAKCKVEDWNWENWPDGINIKIEGVTTCPNTRIDLIFKCDDKFMSSDFAYTDSIGGFSTYAGGQCHGSLNMRYGFKE